MRQTELQTELIKLVPRLRRFAYSLTGNRADGDDLVQATCEKALRNAEQFRKGTRLDSWLYRIAQTLWIDDRRRHQTRGTIVDPDEAGLSDGGKGAALPEDRMMLARVRRAMDSLPDDQRAVIALVGVEGFSYKETAETLDLPLGTVMSRLSRARAALLGGLGEAGGAMQ